MPEDIEASRKAQQDHLMTYPNMKQDFDSYETSFFVKNVDSTAFTDDEGEHLRIVNWNKNVPYCVDIEKNVAMKYTNTDKIEHAAALIDVAIAMNALSLFCLTNDYWGKKEGMSIFRGIPIINAAKIFKEFCTTEHDSESSSDDEEQEVSVKTKSLYKLCDDSFAEITVRVQTSACMLESEKNAHCTDFGIVNARSNCEKAYKFQIDLTGAAEVPELFYAYINTSPLKVNVLPGHGKTIQKKRPISMISSE